MEPMTYFVTCFETFSAAAAHAQAAAERLGHKALVERADDRWLACVPSEDGEARMSSGYGMPCESRQDALEAYDEAKSNFHVELVKRNSAWFLLFPDRESFTFYASGVADDVIEMMIERKEAYEPGSLVDKETLRADREEHEEEQVRERELDEMQEEADSWIRDFRRIEANNG